MYLENDIEKNYTTWDSYVDNNEMVELPRFCSVKNGEEFILVAYNENAAAVVPINMIKDKISSSNKNLEEAGYEFIAQGITGELINYYSTIVTKACAIPMPNDRFGIKLGLVEGMLDKPEDGKKKCVIFQNINGILIMHYGFESFRKNLGLSAEVGRKK